MVMRAPGANESGRWRWWTKTGQLCQKWLDLCPKIAQGSGTVRIGNRRYQCGLCRQTQDCAAVLITVSEGRTPNIFLYSEAKRLG